MLQLITMTDQPTSDPIARFVDACEVEGREHALTGREYRLSGGIRVGGNADLYSDPLDRHSDSPGQFPDSHCRFLYRFDLTRKIPLKDDTNFTISVEGRSIDGSIVAQQDRAVTIAITSDCGATIETALLTISSADLIYALSQRLSALRGAEPSAHFNSHLAHRVLNISQLSTAPLQDALTPPSDLTEEQRAALEGMTAHEISYLWGPPGTGKTTTLAATVYKLFAENMRVLLVSNTNQAVDGILEALCKRVSGKAKLAVPEGSILRVGPIVSDTLATNYGEQIELDSVLRRNEKKTVERLVPLKNDRDALKASISQLETGKTLVRSQAGLREKLAQIEARRRALRPGLFASIRRIFFANGLSKPVVVDETEDLDSEIKLIYSGLTKVAESLKQIDLTSLEADLAESKIRYQELGEAIGGLEELQREMRASALSRARVVATSATRAFLQPQQLTDFDVVVIDEASMLPLPVVFLLAGIARRQVIIAGDFRQLPPIALSSLPVVKQWYSKDIFEAAGIVDLVEAGGQHACLFTLTTQFRSKPEIVSLINGHFYAGKLLTQYSGGEPIVYSDPLAVLNTQAVVIVDSSSLSPLGQSTAKSKANLLHALLVRSIVKQLQICSSPQIQDQLGVIAPYRPQVDLIQDLLSEEQLSSVAVGTVHRFQGEERKIIILDLTESPPHRLGGFLAATSPRETGAKLLNVALTRAKEQLLIVANLEHLRAHLHDHHILKQIITDIEARAAVVSANLFLDLATSVNNNLAPQVSQLSELSQTSQVSQLSQTSQVSQTLQGLTRALFLSTLFDDLRGARRTALIVSPRISKSLVKIITTLLANRPTRLELEIVVPPFSAEVAESLDDYNSSLEMFSKLGCQISERHNLKSGLVIVDDSVAWFGTLRPLACLDSDIGTMTRCTSLVAVQALRKFIIPPTTSNTTSPLGVVNA